MSDMYGRTVPITTIVLGNLRREPRLPGLLVHKAVLDPCPKTSLRHEEDFTSCSDLYLCRSPLGTNGVPASVSKA